MTNTRPVFMTRDELVAVIDDIRTRVAVGDSFEGFLQYELPWSEDMGDPETDDAGGFRVKARYRVGNAAGQGGLRNFGSLS